MRWSKTAITLILFYINLVAVAQNGKNEVSGYVYDTERQPLTGVSVVVKNTNNGTATDINGRYVLRDVHHGAELVFSFIGMKKQTKIYKGQARLDVVLQEDLQQLSMVTVTAKTNINEIDIRAKSGVVQSVDVKRMEQKPMIDMGIALQGMVPGLTITNVGDLGVAPKIRVRGNASLRRGNTTNEPLYVMDGQVISAEIFYNLNPSDIKDIKVLKDAAACALYGVKAANGVLEISSQRGSTGDVMTVYDMSMGITARGRRGIAMMNSDEKLELERLLENDAAPGYRYSADYYNKYFSNSPDLQKMIAEGKMLLDSLRNINTDWFKQLMHTGLYHKHNLSIRGGSENTTYYLSGNYTYQSGRIPGNDKQRMSMRMNIDQKLGKLGYLLLSVNGGYARTQTPNGTTFSPTSLVYDLNPYEQTTGQLYSFPRRTYQDIMNQYSAQDSDKDFGVSGSLTLSPFSGLDITAVAGLSFLLTEGSQFTPSTAYSETRYGIPEIERGIYTKFKNTTANVSTNIRATYNRTFSEKHDLTLGANTDYYLYNMDNVLMRGYGVGTINSAAAINQSLRGNRQPYVNGTRDKNAQLGIGLVLGYTYDNTYDFYATCKWDASSVLPVDKRWNKAWAVGFGWTPTHYAFLKNNRFLSNLNLKASYGYTANLNGVSISSTIASFSYTTHAYENQRPLELIMLYNADLKPEQTRSLDLGFSFDLFKKLSFNFNWYNRRTDQALLDVPIPSSTGFTVLKRNIGVLQNRGVEMSLNARILDTQDWNLIVGTHIAYNSNKVLDLYYADKIYTSEDALIPDYEVGKSYDMLYGPTSLGINPLTGYPVFLKPDGTEKQATEILKAEDVVALGHLTPPYSGSLNFTLSYESFDLDVDFYYTLGGVQRFNYTYVRNKDDANKNAVKNQVGKMWFKTGDEHKVYPTPFYTSTTAENNLELFANSRTIGKSDYLKLSMVSLRYRVPTSFLSKNLPFIKYAKLAFQASNLFTWTSYKESDPESGTLAGTLQPVYSFNINCTF